MRRFGLPSSGAVSGLAFRSANSSRLNKQLPRTPPAAPLTSLVMTTTLVQVASSGKEVVPASSTAPAQLRSSSVF
jgi:hypothetical protein